MYVQLCNLTRRVVSLVLNSGTALHIPPSGVSGELMQVEVLNNAKVKKLQDLGVLAVKEVARVESAEPVASSPQEQKTEPPPEQDNTKSTKDKCVIRTHRFN